MASSSKSLNKHDDSATESKAPRPEPKVDLDLLDAETKAELTKKARAKVDAQAKHDAEEAFLKSETERFERIKNPEVFEEMREITVDLALYADRIIIDGVHYMHGATYTVPKGRYDAMMEIMQMTQRHEDEIQQGTEYSKFYRRERNRVLNWKTGAASNPDGTPVRF